MIILDLTQGTDAWLQARLGVVTASRYKDVLATLKNGSEAATRKNYRAELLIERITHKPIERYQNGAMAWGSETEDLARTMYEIETGNHVEQVGLVLHDTLLAGASPDGLIGVAGGLEIKNPNVATHLDTLKAGKMPTEHLPQVQGNLWITGRKWWDFVSYCPELEGEAGLFIQRIERDEDYIKTLETEITKFLEELEADMRFINEYASKQKVTA